jgi:hypothetical protein
MNRESALEYLAFDHRASIVGYLNEQANAFELGGQRMVAVALRAQASNVAIHCDIASGSRGIATPVDAIILEACAHLGGTNHAEVVGHSATEAARRVRAAAVWVAKKRLRDWTDDQLAHGFNRRERSGISKLVKRADEIRATDNEFRRVTDNLTDQVLRCEACQHNLIPA